MNEAMITQRTPDMGTVGWRGLAAAEGEAPAGDAFALLLAQLLGLGEGPADPDALLAGLQNPVRTAPEDGWEEAMELMAQLYLSAGAAPTLTIPVPEQAPDTAMTQAAPQGIPGAQPLAEALTAQMAQALQALPTAAPAETGEKHSQFPLQSQPAVTPLAEQPEVLADPAADPPSRLPDLEAFQFQAAVRRVADQLGDRPKAQKTQTPDIDALQAAVEQKQFVPDQGRTLEATAPPAQAEAREIIPQLRIGILENLAAGKGEFVVRLKPEGLGEITVKLVEKEGRVLLNILTSSPQVAQALNRGAAALQTALTPLQAELQEIAVAESYTAAGQQPQQQNQNHRPGQQPDREARGRTSLFPDRLLEDIPPAAASGTLYGGALNAYI